jgi:exopolysaccharide biosynthesis polyprenyl glycosylphosphotransferase
MMQTVVRFEVPPVEVRSSAAYRITKRLLDVLVAGVLLILLAPVLAVCALLVRLSSRGPILFRQQRVGRGGEVFTFLKFRSMYIDADPALHREYVTAFIKGQAERHEHHDGPMYKLVRDPRITPIGHILRRTSLDELPQLWNVLRGEMSLVGPRPPIPYEVEEYGPVELRRLAVKPGITGLWQVSGRSRTTFDQMVALDLAYIRQQSLLMDARILLRTLPTILSRSGAQ